ncbi:MAG: thiol peroxidase [Deferribacterota bacterium]|nr:thiol peroxidase [Deferribacterota bacterium]
MEQKNAITMKGQPLTLVGAELKVGDKAPDFTVVDNNLKEKSLDDFRGKIKLFSTTPSLDTPVCDAQVKRFNEEATKLHNNIQIINISMDLPFAMARFCQSNNIDRVLTLSDHREASFGLNYGVLIKELRLLARAIFIVDSNDIIKYIEIVKEATNHPDYDRAINSLKEIS